MTNSIPSEIRELFGSAGVSNNFRAGSILQFQDDNVENIYLVVKGFAVACYFEKNGKETWLDSFGPDEIIGLENLQTGSKSQSQIVARTDIKVVQFGRQNFQDLMAHYPILSKFILMQLVAQLKKFQESRMESNILTKRGRVASEIRRMAEPVDRSSVEYIVSPKPVISEMALRLGIARETVSRTVSELIKNQVIERGSGGFIVPDLRRLEAHVR